MKAYDAAGNTATSATVSVTVDQDSVRFTERFSNSGPDNAGWSLTEWALDASDQTGVTGSKSILGSATPAFNTVTRTASVSVTLTSNPRLTYWRKLDLYGANTMASASFKVVVNNGTDNVVDSVTKTGMGTITEANWTQRADIDLSAYRQPHRHPEVHRHGDGHRLQRQPRQGVGGQHHRGPAERLGRYHAPHGERDRPGQRRHRQRHRRRDGERLGWRRRDEGRVLRRRLLADTDTAAPYVFTWNTAGVANGSHSLMAKAYDAANNVSTDNDTSVTVSNTSGGTTTVSFNSIAADDGYVKANADGTLPAVGTLTTPAAGQGHGRQAQPRLLLLRHLHAAGHRHPRARLAQGDVLLRLGWDPWADPAVGNTLVIDLKNGDVRRRHHGDHRLRRGRHRRRRGGVIKFTTGTQTSTDFNAAGLSAINKLGKTQARLQLHQNQSGTAYVFLTEGTGAVLTVEYK